MEKEDIPHLRGDMATCPRLLTGSLDPLDHSSRPCWLMKLASLKYCQLSFRTASHLREKEGRPLESVTGAVLVNSAELAKLVVSSAQWVWLDWKDLVDT